MELERGEEVPELHFFTHEPNFLQRYNFRIKFAHLHICSRSNKFSNYLTGLSNIPVKYALMKLKDMRILS